MLQDKNLQDGHPYYLKDGILKRCINGNKHILRLLLWQLVTGFTGKIVETGTG